MKTSRTLPLRTPCCDRATLRCSLMLAATIVTRRRCRSCGRQWQVVVRPVRTENRLRMVHVVDWTPIETTFETLAEEASR